MRRGRGPLPDPTAAVSRGGVRRSRRARAAAFLLAVLTAPPAVAGGAAEEPLRIVAVEANRAALSPDGDGEGDSVELTVTIAPAARPISEVELWVHREETDAPGELVAFKRTALAPGGIFGRLVGLGLGGNADEVDVVLVWDGAYRGHAAHPDGARVPDGTYLLQVGIQDSAGRRALTAPRRVAVDRVAPAIDPLASSHEVFSPNGDGVRDEIVVEQVGRGGERWVGTLRGADGAVVRTFESRGDGPEPAVWDGTDAAGRLVPEGEYAYVLVGTDAAGNTAVSEPLRLTLSLTGGDVGLAVAEGPAIVSPNGDGVLDEVPLDVRLSQSEGVDGWCLRLWPADGFRDSVTVRSGVGPPPQTLRFPGPATTGQPPGTTDVPATTGGHSLADGTYLAALEVRYRNGTRVESEPVELTVDTSPPAGRIRLETLPLASPDEKHVVFGGSLRRAVRVAAELEPLLWTATVRYSGPSPEPPAERTTRIDLRNEAAPAVVSIVWDGSDDRGDAVPDGTYTLELTAIDQAGNEGGPDPVVVVRDSRAIRARLGADARGLAPEGAPGYRSVSFSARIDPADAVEESVLTIADGDGRTVRTFVTTDAGRVFRWHGEAVPDGAYRATLTVLALNGNRAVGSAGPVLVDTVPPRIAHLSVASRIVSPNGDGDRDTVTIHQSGSAEQRWIGRVVDRDGRIVLERRWRGDLGDFVWDGRSGSGAIVADGDYTYELSATDAGGNETRSAITLVVDTASLPASRQPPTLSLSASPSPFTPDGDGIDDVVTFAIDASSPNRLERWTLAIDDALGAPFRVLAGDGAPPRSLAWEGRSALGELVRSGGIYFGRLVVEDAHGNAAEAGIRIRVGILVEPDGGDLRIAFPPVTFEAGSSSLFEGPEETISRNLETLRTIAEVLRRYPDREILLEGHASADAAEAPPSVAAEPVDPGPLSALRADAVRRALIVLGVDGDRLRSIGVGAGRPIVPPDDEEGAWRNRRVELILEHK